VSTVSIHLEHPCPFLLDGCKNSSHSKLVILATPFLDDASCFSVQFLPLELYSDTHKDFGGKEDLEECYDDENGSTLVHSVENMMMQVEFAELWVPIWLPANDFPMRKSQPPNLQIFCRDAVILDCWERICAKIMQFCGFGIYCMCEPAH
jgi:hypothetical protein